MATGHFSQIPIFDFATHNPKPRVTLERRRFAIADGIARCKAISVPVVSASLPGIAIVAAFGVDAVRAVLGAGASAGAHHRGALGAVLWGWGVEFGTRAAAHGVTLWNSSALPGVLT